VLLRYCAVRSWIGSEAQTLWKSRFATFSRPAGNAAFS
jgi:hypothetical protein